MYFAITYQMISAHSHHAIARANKVKERRAEEEKLLSRAILKNASIRFDLQFWGASKRKKELPEKGCAQVPGASPSSPRQHRDYGRNSARVFRVRLKRVW